MLRDFDCTKLEYVACVPFILMNIEFVTTALAPAPNPLELSINMLAYAKKLLNEELSMKISLRALLNP